MDADIGLIYLKAPEIALVVPLHLRRAGPSHTGVGELRPYALARASQMHTSVAAAHVPGASTATFTALRCSHTLPVA
jgi:hypothetical protein